jgi:hypothetical protein
MSSAPDLCFQHTFSLASIPKSVYVSPIEELKGHTLLLVHRGHTQANLLPEVQHVLTDRTRLEETLQDFQRFAPEVVLDMIPYTQSEM